MYIIFIDFGNYSVYSRETQRQTSLPFRFRIVKGWDYMKRIIILLICLAMVAGMIGCGKKVKEVEGSVVDLVQQIYDNLEESVELPFVMNIPLTPDMENISYYLGVGSLKFTDGVASEGAFMNVAHSVVLIRLEDGEDVDKAKTLIKDNVDPCKWICNGVDPSEVVVDNIGHLVILIMSKGISGELHDAFKKLAQ